MTKKDLRNGSIIVNRAGYLGVVIKDEEYILYQEIGMDNLDDFHDDLTFEDSNYRDGDIMEVYHNCTFIDLNDSLPAWVRDTNWQRPTEEERKAREARQEQERQMRLEDLRKQQAEAEAARKDYIHIISQFFYGNRSGTEITREGVDYFLRGDLSNTFNPKEVEDVVRKTIHVPGAEHIVIVYDQMQEDNYVNVDFPSYYADAGADYLARWGEELKMVVSCEIPELGITLHTRCIACRMDENGVLQSLEDSDYEKFIHYFPAR